MAKRLNNQSTIGAVLQEILSANKLQPGMDQIDVKEAWRQLMGNGVNTYTKNVVLKGSTLYVELGSAVLREELSHGKSKIIKMINEELRRDVVKEVVLR
ncbi:RNA-binding protein [Flavobacterium sp. IR1]|nr:RNA-binding protein [Flavobacterium sp. IR1]